MRQRLSWDEEKAAAIMKTADPYTMNQERHNPPAAKYDVGGPKDFGEDPHMATPWKNEGRTEDGHAAPSPSARAAVVQARKLEDKALKCITIAQRMLPGAEDALIEDQATDLMFMPERSIMATLQRQSELATKIAGEDTEEKPKPKLDADGNPIDKDAAAKCKEEEEEEEATASKAKPKTDETLVDPKSKKPEGLDLEAKKVEEMNPEEEEEATASKAKPKTDETLVDPKSKKPEGLDLEAKKNPVVDPEEVKPEEASSKKEADLLDILFDNAEVTASETPKAGAKKLSGLVKQASSSGDPLANLWDTPPDVSAAFK